MIKPISVHNNYKNIHFKGDNIAETHDTVNNPANTQMNLQKYGISLLVISGVFTGVEFAYDRIFERRKIHNEFTNLLKPENKEDLRKCKETFNQFNVEFDENRIRKIINDKKKFTDYLLEKNFLIKVTPKNLIKMFAINAAKIGVFGSILAGLFYVMDKSALFINKKLAKQQGTKPTEKIAVKT